VQNSQKSSRTTRYMRRIHAHLPTLAHDVARRAFISGEIGKWEERYARFIETEGESHRRSDAPNQPTAFDFVETIAALGGVQSQLNEKAAG
jgi:hypothetical protein